MCQGIAPFLAIEKREVGVPGSPSEFSSRPCYMHQSTPLVLEFLCFLAAAASFTHRPMATVSTSYSLTLKSRSLLHHFSITPNASNLEDSPNRSSSRYQLLLQASLLIIYACDTALSPRFNLLSTLLWLCELPIFSCLLFPKLSFFFSRVGFSVALALPHASSMYYPWVSFGILQDFVTLFYWCLMTMTTT